VLMNSIAKKNNLSCYNKLCVKYYSLATLTDVSDALTTSEKFSLCEYGMVALDPFDDKMRCTSLVPLKDVDPTTKLTACNYTMSEPCTYNNTVTNSTVNFDCTCGLNAAGTSYCPKKMIKIVLMHGKIIILNSLTLITMDVIQNQDMIAI